MATLRMISVCVLTMAAVPAMAADNLVGHKVSVTRYGGKPAVGKGYTLTMLAGQNGNPTTFALPANPVSGGGYAIVERDGGILRDPLTAGTWTGLGNPAGSKGWKYKNTAAPLGGAVKILLIKEKVIRLVARDTGSMPPPSASGGRIDTTIAADGERYCARAASPYFAEVDGKLIKSKDQPAAPGCPACLVGTDSDGDRLDDCYETDTGIFAAPSDAGTDPLDADTDGDGIQDGDETIGTSDHLDLPALGTNPLRHDILLEYDWFDDSLECGPHSHRPTPASLAMVTAMFAAAPVANPDGSTGIHFIHDYGQGGAFTGGNLIHDSDGVIGNGVNDVEYLNHKFFNLAPNRNGYFHYVILPHRYDISSNSSGQAEIAGDDMIVSLQCYLYDDYVANTIAHELGHNLDLRHGGFDNCNYKPNYNSVMNYLYQFPGVDSDCTPPGNGVLDYSVGDRLPLDENALDETQGTCGAPPWDWNGNSSIESGVVFDVNSQDPIENFLCAGTLTVLQDYDDWANLFYGGVLESDGAGARRPVPEIIDCDNPPPPRPPAS